jgi:hypothetical protein
MVVRSRCFFQLDKVLVFEHATHRILLQVSGIIRRPIYLVIGVPKLHRGWRGQGRIHWHYRRRCGNLCVQNTVYNEYEGRSSCRAYQLQSHLIRGLHWIIARYLPTAGFKKYPILPQHHLASNLISTRELAELCGDMTTHSLL